MERNMPNSALDIGFSIRCPTKTRVANLVLELPDCRLDCSIIRTAQAKVKETHYPAY